MTKELLFLIPEFRTKLKALLTACQDRDVRMEPYSTIMTAQQQAARWRQGRSQAETELKILALEHAEAPFIASCLREAKLSETNLVTEILPGFSWHNWAEAAQCVWVDSRNKLNWSAQWKDRPSQFNGYQVFAEEAARLGLTHGSMVGSDWSQVQLRSAESPRHVYSLAEINAEMQKRYELVLVLQNH